MGADLFLIGDSHIIALCDAAQAKGISWVGGPLGSGRMLEDPFWEIDGTTFIYTREGAGPIRHRFEELLSFEGPILSTLGFNSHRFVLDFEAFAKSQHLPASPRILSKSAFSDTVRDSRRTTMAFYQMLADHGREVWFTCSPQRVATGLMPVLNAFENILIADIQSTGARFVDFRHKGCSGGQLDEKYALAGDPVHGNASLGGLILDCYADCRAAQLESIS